MRPPTSPHPALAVLVALFGGGACMHGRPAPVAPAPPAAAPAAPPAAKVRYFHASYDDTFWVSRHPAKGPELAVASGARIEVGPDGEIVSAGWDTDLASRSEPVSGALAVPERLGGGFVAWTRARVFFTRDFTGPLQPVATGLPGDTAMRGARAGLSSVIVVTDAGPRDLAPGSMRLTPIGEPAILDLAALSAERAARLDLFGRLSVTSDRGAHWLDLTPQAGNGVRQIAVGPADLWVDTWQGRMLVSPSGKLEQADPPDRNWSYDSLRGFQTAWKSSHERDNWPWALRETSPLGVAVGSGADAGDGTAVGVVQGAVVRVDLATGKLLTMATDWLPNGLSCQAIAAPDGVLFACGAEPSQGYGAYVLRSTDGGPPALEKAFSDDGIFVAGEGGALGYVGACQAQLRAIDPNDTSRYEMPESASVRPLICVRRGPGEWVERRVDLPEGATLTAWAPRRDGTAAALAFSGDPLPPPAGVHRVIDQGGVRLVLLYPEIPGWAWKHPPWYYYRNGPMGHVERRFVAHDDGSVDGWLYPAGESYEPISIGVTIDPSGVLFPHDGPAGMTETVTGGAFGVALSKDGSLHETTDHGRTWRSAGFSPVPPGPAYRQACSSLGCILGAVVRVGWGDSALVPRVSTASFAPQEPAPPPRLACSPRGAPVPLAAPPPAPPGNRQTVNTGWGDTMEIVRDAAAPEPPPPPGTGPPRPAPAPTPSAPPAKGPKSAPRASPVVLRTHTLLLRAPFSPFAPLRRLNATDASFNPQRRTTVVPLLAPSGDVDVLVMSDRSELLVSGDKIAVLPSFETRRYGSDGGFTGFSMPGGRALVLGEVRHRLTLEDHGPGPTPPPVFLGQERSSRHRPMALARRDDGTLGVIVADGGAPETAGISIVDRLGGSLQPPTRLAPWSTAITADDPRCRKGKDPGAWDVLLVVDPAAWLAIDPSALPGVSLQHQGLLRVRWSAERVCVEGLDAAASDGHRRGEPMRSWSLVAHWGGEKDHGATLRTTDLRQELVCRIERAPERER